MVAGFSDFFFFAVVFFGIRVYDESPVQAFVDMAF
jgi:hypothetical protein